MATKHLAQLKITNNTEYTLTYQYGWFAPGGPSVGGPPYPFPKTIGPNSEVDGPIWSSSYDGTTLSGYAIYTTNQSTPVPITFAFSNPAIGTNKLGVGIANGNGQGGDNSVYKDMDNHDYQPFSEFFSVFIASCSCTGEDYNDARVALSLL